MCLRGMIIFIPGHYISVFYDIDIQAWVKYDDIIVSRVGQGRYRDLVEMLVKYRFSPVGVFYEAIPLQHSPKKLSESEWIELERFAKDLDIKRRIALEKKNKSLRKPLP